MNTIWLAARAGLRFAGWRMTSYDTSRLRDISIILMGRFSPRAAMGCLHLIDIVLP